MTYKEDHALRDRTVKVDVPYMLRWQEENQVYERTDLTPAALALWRTASAASKNFFTKHKKKIPKIGCEIIEES